MTPGSSPAWAQREPDEPVLDWMLRLQVSLAAARAHAAGLIPGGQKIPPPELPRGCGEFHAGECTAGWPFTTERTAS